MTNKQRRPIACGSHTVRHRNLQGWLTSMNSRRGNLPVYERRRKKLGGWRIRELTRGRRMRIYEMAAGSGKGVCCLRCGTVAAAQRLKPKAAGTLRGRVLQGRSIICFNHSRNRARGICDSAKLKNLNGHAPQRRTKFWNTAPRKRRGPQNPHGD